MCEYFDAYWQYAIGFLLVLAIFTILLRLKYASAASELPYWLTVLFFGSKGLVAITMLLLMVMGFICAGSPGDMNAIVPN